MRILFTFLLITLTATATHTHTATNCGNSGNSSSSGSTTQQQCPQIQLICLCPRRLDSPRSASSHCQVSLIMVSECEVYLDQLSLPLPPSLPLTCALLSYSLPASIPNATNTTTQDSRLETVELIRLMRKEEDNNCIR